MTKEKMSWKEIQEKYPDKWVALTDAEKSGSKIISAVPVKVCDESEMYDAELELKAAGILFTWRRTTELEGANILCELQTND
ncbi:MULTISPECIES: hypothetical protein [unclassified Butyrivibrio]|jgi:hypothetical protein|uniref:hypothetical protein n=1 Tax=unclassified Butyrivibrio TaxID=2639466 RepID=UPI0004222E3C|nr:MULTISPECIES: hypothetical protein [unclassified Butyrivibrio]